MGPLRFELKTFRFPDGKPVSVERSNRFSILVPLGTKNMTELRAL